MSIRVDILDSFYTHLSTITVGNGYTSSYLPLKSIGNGSIAIEKEGVHFAIQPDEESSVGNGQSLFFLSAMVHLMSYKKYPLRALSNNDYEIEKAKSDMIQDLRRAYSIESEGMCSAGINSLDYLRELVPENAGANMVAIKLEFEMKWYENR